MCIRNMVILYASNTLQPMRNAKIIDGIIQNNEFGSTLHGTVFLEMAIIAFQNKMSSTKLHFYFRFLVSCKIFIKCKSHINRNNKYLSL